MRPPGRGVRPAPRASPDQRCHLTPPTRYMEQPSCSSSQSSDCLASNILLKGRASSLTTTKPTPAAMEMSYSCPLPLQENDFLFDCESLLGKSYDPVACDPTSDPGYFSAGSSLSPTSSVDSFCFSPTSFQAAGNEQDALESFLFTSPAPATPGSTTAAQASPCSRSSKTASASKKSRSRYPGMKRQTASEREKLRMRDLTKALHHLRTYLPSSVAPTGQTLTKIETLRLTIRYISYLSAQLGPTEEVMEQRQAAQQPQTPNQYLGQPGVSCSPQGSTCSIMRASQLSPLQQAYQFSSGLCFSSEQYWTPPPAAAAAAAAAPQRRLHWTLLRGNSNKSHELISLQQ